MGSIPLPALSIRPPQEQPNPLDQYARLMQIKQLQQNAPLENQQLQQKVQSGQLELQQQQLQQKDQQAVTTAMKDWDGKDYNQIVPLVIKNGGSGQAVMGLKKSILDQQTQIATAAKDNAQATSDNINATLKKNDLVTGALSPLADPKAVPDDQLAQTLTSTVQSLVRQGALDPQHAQAAALLAQSGNPAAIRAGVDQFSKTLMAHTQIVDEAAKQAGILRGQAETSQAASNAAATQQHQKVEERQEGQRIGLENARLAFDKQKQGTQDQQSIEQQAQQIASGEVKGLSQARNNPFARAVMERVYEINPKYADSLYSATQDLRSSKPNSSGANVQRLGTAILHGDEALQKSNDLGFSEGMATGIPTSGSAAYKQSAEFLTGEIGQYVTGGKLTVDEGKKLSSDLMSSRQGVRDSAIHEVIKLSKGKLQSQMEQYKNATGQEFPTERVFNDGDINAALHKHGVIDEAPKGNAPPPGAKVRDYTQLGGQ